MGDFFGELAALDWDAGYGYSRTATVMATSYMRLLVSSSDEPARLVDDVPVIESRIRAAVKRDLQRV